MLIETAKQRLQDSPAEVREFVEGICIPDRTARLVGLQSGNGKVPRRVLSRCSSANLPEDPLWTDELKLDGYRHARSEVRRQSQAALPHGKSNAESESRAAPARGTNTFAGTDNVRDHAQKVTSGRLRAGRGGRYRSRTRSQGPDQQSQALPRALTRVVCCFKADEACLRGLSGVAPQILHPLEHAWHEFPEFIAFQKE
jgi:hypothetical protein